MFRALIYLRAVSAANRTKTALLRLREPRYLLGGICALLYFYYFLFRNYVTYRPGGHGLPPAGVFDPMVLIGAMGLGLIILYVAAAWLFPSARLAHLFTPAEIAFLFPAPISRRALVHFSFASGQFRMLMQALIFGIIWSRRGFTLEVAAMRVVGWWVVFSTASLHRTGAGLVYARIREGGGSIKPLRIAAIGVAAAFVGAVVLSLWANVRAPGMEELSDAAQFGRYLEDLLRTGALPWILWPFRVVIGPFLARDAGSFVPALGLALAFLALHYLWVTRLEVSFEEASIAQAERFAQIRSAIQEGRAPIALLRKPQARRDPFRLRDRGRPEIALLWKNLVSLSALFSARFIRVAAVLLIALFVVLNRFHPRSSGANGFAIFVLVMCVLAAVYILILGPLILRQDLRGDLPHWDTLRTFPLAGWQIVIGEMLAATAILTAIMWATLATATVAAGELSGSHDPLGPALRLAIAACAGVVAPFLCALALLLPTALVVLFPAWSPAVQSRVGGGFEAIGQRMLFFLAQVILLVFGILPAVVLAPVLIFASQWLIGMIPAVLLATAAVLGIFGGELAASVWWLGRRFESSA